MNAAIAMLRPASRTLLIPLAGRVHASTIAPQSGFRDPVAEAFAARLALDLAHFAEDRTVAQGSVRRAQVFDAATRVFLSENPGAQVINIGAGLCTRYSRVNGAVRWIEVDFADVIALRRTLETETPVHRFMALDCDDPNAARTIEPLLGEGPTLIIAEGVLMFLEPHAVASLLTMAASAGANTALLFDYLHPVTARIAPRFNRSLRATGGVYRWSVANLARLVAAVGSLTIRSDNLFNAAQPRWARLADRLARALFGGSLIIAYCR